MKENNLSPWGAAAAVQLSKDLADVYFKEQLDYLYKLKLSSDSLWISIHYNDKECLTCRVAFSPVNDIEMASMEETGDNLQLKLKSAIGDYTISISWPDTTGAVLHYTVSLKPAASVYVPFWPRDLLVTGNGNPRRVKGEVNISQVGTRTGLIYASITEPEAGSFLYLQNFSALNTYFIETKTSARDTVGGTWPELGFSLPSTADKALRAKNDYTIADTFIAFDPHVPKDQFEIAIGFTNLLARLYLHLPRPETIYHNYLEIVENALESLQSKACWNYVNGHPYINAYLCDYNTPPEIMVQLAVLLPVYDYQKWNGKRNIQIARDLEKGWASFYNEDLKTIVRWLPAAEDQLDESEEQKVPGIMDAWYLHHPLLNVSRLALNGDNKAKELFLTSLAYARKVARHFNYQWPVFYDMYTLEIIKEETAAGKGGEKDVAGVYALLMLQAYELTKEDSYLKEAERAAKSLERYGFDIFYQANNTAFSAGAMLRLWKITRNDRYLKLSYLLLANLFKNLSLWTCEYGYGKNFPTFFGLFPLNDAPYMAVYEEAEVFAAIHDYFFHAEGEEILPAFSTLLAEFIRFMVHRAVHYYPPMLPEEMVAEEIKTGELDRKLWVPLEDIHDGWEKSGSVGQEVYGAGLGFGVVPQHYIKVDDRFMIYLDYPFSKPQFRKKSVSFKVFGSSQMTFRLMIIKNSEKSLPKELQVTAESKESANGSPTKDGHLEFLLFAGQKVKITW